MSASITVSQNELVKSPLRPEFHTLHRTVNKKCIKT